MTEPVGTCIHEFSLQKLQAKFGPKKAPSVPATGHGAESLAADLGIVSCLWERKMAPSERLKRPPRTFEACS
jgi:hypothetical protein